MLIHLKPLQSSLNGNLMSQVVKDQEDPQEEEDALLLYQDPQEVAEHSLPMATHHK